MFRCRRCKADVKLVRFFLFSLTSGCIRRDAIVTASGGRQLVFQRNRQWNRQWQSVVAALSKSLKRLRQRNKAGLSTYMGDSGSILASPGCPLGPQQPPNRRPHARRDRHPRQLRRQLPRRDSRRGCVCSMRLDYAFGFSAVV